MKLLVALFLSLAALSFGDDVVTAVVRDSALDLSGAWHAKAVAQVEDSLFSVSLDDSAWPVVQAPGRWADQKIVTGGAPAVVYRRTVSVPADWKGKKIGISAWFCAGDSLVYVNGQEVDPTGPSNALSADVSSLLRYGQDNLVGVSTTVDGIREMAGMDPPLLGPLGQKHVTRILRKDVVIPGTALKANFFAPEGGEQLPIVVFAATGHVDYPLKDDWRFLNEDLARLGYESLAVQFNKFTPQELDAVFSYLGSSYSRVALVGAMKASRPVVLAAAAHPDVRAVILISSAKVPEITQIADRPVLFISSDRTLSAARDMAASLSGPRDVTVLPGSEGGLALLDTSWNGLRRAILDWLGKYL